MDWWVLVLVALGVLCLVGAAIGVQTRVSLALLGAALVVSGVWLVPAITAV